MSPHPRPLAEVASVWIGRGGAFVEVVAMLSAYEYISAETLNAPRLAYSFAAHGDFPAFLARLHARFSTPGLAILLWVF
jgi:amino acid transporter